MGILNKKKRFIDLVVTAHGKRKLAENHFSPALGSLTDMHTMYDTDSSSSAKNTSDNDRISIETPFKKTTDVIVHEFDDSGKLSIFDISGSSIVGNKIFTATTNEGNTTDIKKLISTGSIFASNNAVTEASIKRFQRNKFIRTLDTFESDNITFELDKQKHTFVISNSVPFPLGPHSDGININNAEPLMFDDKLAHFGNFQYMPPKNKDGSNISNYEDLRGTSRKTYEDIKSSLRITRIPDDFLIQNNTVVNQVEINAEETLAVLNRAPLQDVSTLIAKEHVSINFKKTSYFNNLILQIYEKNFNNDELSKLDIVDAGEFRDDIDKNRPNKRVFYVGKIFKDSNDNNTFVNIFTLIWD